MEALKALKQSIKNLESLSKKVQSLELPSEVDELEVSAQEIVFRLQMQANQVAGELGPGFSKKRIELQQNAAARALKRLAGLRAKNNEVIPKKETAIKDPNSGDSKPESAEEKPVELEIKDKEKIEDDGNDNRQLESNSGDGKPESAEEAK